MKFDSPAIRLLTVLIVLGFACLPADAAKKKFKASYEGSLVVEFTDNQFRFSEDQFARFDLEQAPGERYFDMDDPEDVVNRLNLRADLKWRLDKRRDFRVLLRGSYIAHTRNSVSDYPRLDVELRHDVTRNDRIYGGINFVFDRFWRNNRVANSTLFAPAIYDQAVIRLGYEREIHKHWKIGGEYRDQSRNYDSPLDGRDREGDYFAVTTSYDFSKRTEGKTQIHYGDIETPVELDGGIPEDRSFTEWEVEHTFGFKPSKKTRVDLRLQFRERNGSTDFAQDLARFDRVDQRARLRLSVERKLRKKLTIEGRVMYTDNDSDRIDPTILTDEVGYKETVLALGLRYKI